MHDVTHTTQRITAAALAALLAAAMLAGCGTTSSLEAPVERAAIDLTPYSKLLVEDFFLLFEFGDLFFIPLFFRNNFFSHLLKIIK